MNDFMYYSPTEFIFGRNTEEQTGEALLRYGARRVLVLYGGGSVVRSGLLARVEASLQHSGLPYALLGGISPNPLDDKVREGIDLVRREEIDFLLPVGGGSVIDTAKAIAAGAPYAGDFWDFFAGKAEVKEALPVGVVLTIPAAGSEASGNSVITRREGMQKLSLRTPRALRPRFAVMNPELTYTLSPYQTAAGVVDMMVHVMERYFSNTPDCGLTDRLCEATLATLVEEGRKVMSRPQDYGVRANLMWAGTIAHGGICGTGREEDWASHFMEHELSALYDVTHGAGLAVIVPAWMEYLLEKAALSDTDCGNVCTHPADIAHLAHPAHLARFAHFAHRVMGVAEGGQPLAEAREGIRKLRAFFREIGMPLSFREIGAREEDIPELVSRLHRHKGPTVGFFCRLTPTDTEAIYRLAARQPID